MPLVEIKGLSFSYPEHSHPALDGVSFKVNAGEFMVLCGKSGCGKSTLLRHLRTVLTPFGTRSGEILFEGRSLCSIGKREQASRIGFVQQSPENQIVTDKVWHELAFGLESLGTKTEIIRRRVAEMASFFGLQQWYERSVHELSGGQKQILALASVLAVQPDVLILDEPTAQLDPIAAEDFIKTLQKINNEIGTTILLSEHRLEGVLPRADHVVVMSAGRVISEGDVSSIARGLKTLDDPMLMAMPTPLRVYLALEEDGKGATSQGSSEIGATSVPQTVREGRLFLEERYGARAGLASASLLAERDAAARVTVLPEAAPLLEMKDVWFRYERDGSDTVKDCALTVCEGEFVCVAGGNGTGKSTLLGVIAGENRHYRGRVRTLGLDPRKASGSELSNAGLGMLPQDPQTLFTRATVYDNLIEVALAAARRRGEKPELEAVETEVRHICDLTQTTSLMGFHPYDVSGGEQQRTGLAMTLLTRPKLLVMDEPTKGMDSFFKEQFAAIIRRLCAEGKGVLMVSHDVEFCAKHASRCALFFNGSVVSEGTPRAFFSGNSFYTTAANRMARGLFKEAIAADEIIELCRGLDLS